MRMLTSVYVCAAVVFLASPLTCADEVHDKLTVAIEKHQERRDAAAAALVAVYQERITELTSKGDTTLASEYLNDMEEFKSRRALLGRPDLAIHFKTYGKAVKEAGDELNEAYSEAMRTVYRSHREDPLVELLFAESLMNLQPWKTSRFYRSPSCSGGAIRKCQNWPANPALCRRRISR